MDKFGDGSADNTGMLFLALIALSAVAVVALALVVDARRSTAVDPQAIVGEDATMEPSAFAQVAADTLRVPSQMP